MFDEGHRTDRAAGQADEPPSVVDGSSSARPYSDCTDQELTDGVGQLTAAMAAMDRQRLAMIAEIDRRHAHNADGCRTVADWVQQATACSRSTARDTATVAEKLEGLPAIAMAYEDGRLSFDQTVQLCRFASAETDRVLAEKAAGYSVSHLQTAARRHNRPTDRDDRRVWRERNLRWWPSRDGLSMKFAGEIPIVAGRLAESALDKRQRELPRDPDRKEPFAARCADAFVALVQAELPDRPSIRPAVVIHADHDIVFDERGEPIPGVAETANGDPLADNVLRRILCDATWQFATHDHDGTTLATTGTSRGWPAKLARVISHRDGGCRFPGCGSRVLNEIHHIHEHHRGGPTATGNGVTLCWWHHDFIHREHWVIEGHPDRELAFRSPIGRRLTSRPDRLRPDTRRQLPLA